MTAGLVILLLKIAVSAVTLLLIASLIALAAGRVKLHGRINLAFFGLTLAALIGLELTIHLLYPGMVQEYLTAKNNLTELHVHLAFSLPSAVLLFLMLFTGLKHHRRLHIASGILFGILWTGTFISGVFFLDPF